MITEILFALLAANAVSEAVVWVGIDKGVLAALFLFAWLVWIKKRRGWKRFSEIVEHFNQLILRFYGRKVSVNTAIMVLALLLLLLLQAL